MERCSLGAVLRRKDFLGVKKASLSWPLGKISTCVDCLVLKLLFSKCFVPSSKIILKFKKFYVW